MLNNSFKIRQLLIGSWLSFWSVYHLVQWFSFFFLPFFFFYWQGVGWEDGVDSEAHK